MSADCATSTIWPDFYLSGRDMPDVHSVAVRGLHLPQGILCPNIWGVSKPQPAVLDIELVLSQGVHSAAAKDALDTSTIDYGLLSKRVRASNESAINVSETFVRIKDIISRSSIDNNTVSHAVSQGRLAIRLPKSTVYGENITIVDHWSSTVKDSNLLKPTRPGGENYSESPVSSRIVTFSRLRTMTLIGVNANERTGPQALLVTCSLFFAAGQGQETDTLSALSYERALVEHVQNTTFETLEALSQHLYSKIAADTLGWTSAIGVRLRLEKPNAVLYADAPAIEIMRSFER